jgi:carbamoyl-phosphate synthase large subunit
MENGTILVTGIGGNVGQGILRNIRSVYPNITLVGTNTLGFSAGNHLCGSVYEVPYAYDPSYIEVVRRIVEKHAVGLIIPSTDYEVYYLSLHKEQLGVPVLASHHSAAEIFLDKYLTSLAFGKYNIPFAKTVLPTAYKGEFAQNIAKPRKGRGSRGLIFNCTDTAALTDEEYLVQELVKGREITTAFYITRQNDLLGHITMERSLENGATSFCRVIHDYDKELEKIIHLMRAHFDICGSLNIQSIVDSNNTIVPFEINGRISGTNSIRSNFGFADVIYGVEEWLFNKKPSAPKIKDGMAVRILMDVIYPGSENTDNITGHTPHYIF